MEIPAELDITNRLAQQSAGNQTAPGELGRDAFLELLVTQLTNQDPLNPLDDHEFVAQLATFSSLEQLENLNEGMQTSILMSQSVNNSLATTLIGKEVLAAGSNVHLGSEGSRSFEVDLADDANLVVLIRNSEGKVVQRLDEGLSSSGRNSVEWDGNDEQGNRAPEGEYTVEVLATSAAGSSVASSVMMRAEVTGVRFFNGTGFLMLEDQMLPLSSVVEVFGGSDS